MQLALLDRASGWKRLQTSFHNHLLEATAALPRLLATGCSRQVPIGEVIQRVVCKSIAIVARPDILAGGSWCLTTLLIMRPRAAVEMQSYLLMQQMHSIP